MRFLSLPPLGHLPSFSVGLSLGQLVTWGCVFYTFALLAHPIELSLGLTRAESSFAFSLALLGEGLLAFWVGRWIDAGHERWVMTGGSIVVGLGLLAHSQVNSLTAFYLVWAWLGLGLSATLYTPAFAVVTRRFPNEFRRAIIMMTFLGGLASTVFIPLSSWLIDTWGWRHALVVLGLVQLGLCVPLHAWLLRGGRSAPVRHTAQVGAQDGAQDGARDGAQDEAQNGAVPVRVPVQVFLKQSPFWLLSLFMILMMMVTSALPVHLVNLLRESGLPPVWVLAIPASIGVIQVIGRWLLFMFEKHLDVHLANRWIPMLIPLGLCALVFGGITTLPALGFVLLFGLGNGLITIVKGTAFRSTSAVTTWGS